MDLQNKEGDFQKKIQLFFLIAAGAALCPLVLVDGLFPGMGYLITEKYLAVPCLLFAGSALSSRLSSLARKLLVLAAMAILWFVAVQTHHHLNHMDTSNFGLFAVGYLLAFPYAAVTREGEENTGLKWIGRCYLAFSLVMILFAGMLLLDAVPAALANRLTWDGARVALLWHPNGVGCLFMVAMGFSLYFLTQTDKNWEKALLAALMVLQFMVLSLTNSRTTILLTCAMVGGTVFFRLWKGTWKQFLAGAVAAAVTIALLFCAYTAVFDLNTRIQTEKLVQKLETQTDPASGGQWLVVDQETGEVSVSGQSGQGELLEDMKNLNGRGGIWRAAVTTARDNPSVRIWGTQYVSAELSCRNVFWVAHAHNSWLQTMMLMGIPGLLMALVYTVIAAWNIWILIWNRNMDLGRKVVAMMVICLLGTGVLEIYLFTGDMTTAFANFPFFLCTGYLIRWNSERK